MPHIFTVTGKLLVELHKYVAGLEYLYQLSQCLCVRLHVYIWLLVKHLFRPLQFVVISYLKMYRAKNAS